MLSQQGKRKNFDALVIGSGIAGLSYCLQLSKHLPKAKIALICKKELLESNSRYAQGGIAAVSGEEDSIEKHIADTLQAGDGLCFPASVEAIIEQGPAAIDFLQRQGVEFDNKGKKPELGREGGHSTRRIFKAGDHTGHVVVDGLIAALKKRDNVTLLSHHAAINLITQTPKHKPGERAEVIGAYVLNTNTGLIDTLLAKVTVLATGGAGRVYRYTSNPNTATGDGLAMAYRAGARLGNMEFYQFHPTLLYNLDHNNFLISEALRGEGALLRLPDTGERFMMRYARKDLELATRDVVARAIFNEIEHGPYSYVYLDATALGKPFLQKRFPAIFKQLQHWGLDISKEPIPVVPAAHYLCGGILADINGKTDLPRLYAVGETAFTGLHGANRLASNALLEGVVTARLAASDSVDWLEKEFVLYQDINNWDSECVTDTRRASQISAHWRGLRGEMHSYAGIVRTEAGLKDLLALIRTRKEMIEDYYWKSLVTLDVIELRNIVTVAELIVRSALQRCETRGGHYREDYPERSDTSEESIVFVEETNIGMN